MVFPLSNSREQVKDSEEKVLDSKTNQSRHQLPEHLTIKSKKVSQAVTDLKSKQLEAGQEEASPTMRDSFQAREISIEQESDSNALSGYDQNALSDYDLTAKSDYDQNALYGADLDTQSEYDQNALSGPDLDALPDYYSGQKGYFPTESSSQSPINKIASNTDSVASILKKLKEKVKNDQIFSYLPSNIKDSIGEKKATSILTHLQKYAIDHFTKIKANQSLIVEDNDMKLLIKHSGKIYVYVSKLGEGGFKTTENYLLITDLNKDIQETSQLIFRAVALPKDHVIARSGQQTNNEIKREIAFNKFLKTAAKQNDLSHVNIVKSVVPLTKVAMNTTIQNLSDTAVENQGMMNELFDANVESYLSKNPFLTYKELITISLKMAQSIRELHQIEVVHRDIKPDNFLIKKNGDDLTVKITDFGRSSGPGIYRYEDKVFYILIADPVWRDLALDHEQVFSAESDIYQLGITLALVLTQTPIERLDAEYRDKKMKARDPDKFLHADWKQSPENWKLIKRVQKRADREFILRILNPLDPSQRPSIDEIINYLKTREL